MALRRKSQRLPPALETLRAEFACGVLCRGGSFSGHPWVSSTSGISRPRHLPGRAAPGRPSRACGAAWRGLRGRRRGTQTCRCLRAIAAKISSQVFVGVKQTTLVVSLLERRNRPVGETITVQGIWRYGETVLAWVALNGLNWS